MSSRTLLILSLLVIGGCGTSQFSWPWDHKDAVPATPYAAWVVNDMENLTEQTPRREDPLIYDFRTQGVSLFAAGNETISFQLVVQAGTAPIENLQVAWTPLAGAAGSIPAANIKAYRMLPVAVNDFPAWYIRMSDRPPQPASFYDVLVPTDAPRQGLPVSVAPGQRVAFWVDLYVPRTAAAGDYAGRLNVACRGGPDWSTPIKLQVYELVLGDARPLTAIGGFDHEQIFAAMVQRDGQPYVPAHMDRANPQVAKGLAIMRDLIVQAHEHRLDLFDKQLHPLLKRDAAGQIVLDWDDYDAIVQPCLDGNAFGDHVPLPAWPSPLSETWPDARYYTGAAAGGYDQTVAELAAAVKEHFAQLKFEGQLFCWPCRGEVSPGAYDRFMRLAALIRKGDAGVPLLSELPPNPTPMAGWSVPADFAATATIFAPPAPWMDGRQARVHSPGEDVLGGLWLSPDSPPYSPGLGPLASPADVRAIAYLAAKYGCRGIFLGDVLNWSADPYAPYGGVRLFYPGTIAGVEGVLPSVRLKRLRRGLLDAAYLAVLQARQQQDAALRVIEAMVRYGGLGASGDHYLDARLDGWVRDGALWHVARRLLAEEARQAVNPSEQSFEELIARRIAWKDISDAARAVRVEQVRAKITLAPKADGADAAIGAQLTLDLYNQTEAEANVVVRALDLPPGWQGPAQDAAISLPPALLRTLTLPLAGPAMPQTASGKFPVRLSLEAAGAASTAVGYVPLLQSPWAARAPKIGDDLSEWPARGGDLAGDFQLIGRRGAIDGGLAQRQTQAWVSNDDDNVYIALRCREHNMPGIVSRSDNQVRYQQLLACQEDLVEVLLDPGYAAGSMGDVYHIVIKPTGAVITERGLGSVPPLGAHQPWAANIQASVTKLDQEWVVKLVVPRASMGAPGKERLWGVNFARYACQGGEASSWAPAARYFYDPRNLGSMVLAAPVAADATTPARGPR